MNLMNNKGFVVTENLLHSPSTKLEPAGCLCCSPFKLAGSPTRRNFLGAGAAAVAAGMMGFMPGKSEAASGNYESMFVNCIDPRFTTLRWQYMGLLHGVTR